MDNLTHSLFGALTADLCFYGVQTRKTVSSGFRKAAWFSSILANNFPDLDFLYARSIGPRHLSYLLHHRGHTHTFLAAIPLGILVALIALGLARFFKWSLTRSEKLVVGALSVFGIVTHIALDFLNTYGVHPLWPFDNRWFYGDILFIIEPWVWMVLLLPVLFVSSWKSIQYGSRLALLLAFGLVFFSGRVVLSASIPLVLFCIPYFLFLKRLKPKCRPFVAFIGFCIVIAVFASQRSQVRQILMGDAKDVIVSPMPANPWCWRAITVEINRPESIYRMRRAMVTTWPDWMSLDRCLDSLGVVWPLKDTVRIGHTELVWMGNTDRSLKELQDYHGKYCDIQGYLKFSRAPYLWNEGGKTMISDLRFDLVKVRGFSVLEAGTSQAPDCPAMPPWVEPRRDLLP